MNSNIGNYKEEASVDNESNVDDNSGKIEDNLASKQNADNSNKSNNKRNKKMLVCISFVSLQCIVLA